MIEDSGEYIKTKVRGDGVSDDRVGVNESYEARIRGALSPLWLLVDILTDEGKFEGKQEILKETAKQCKEIHCDKILNLLKDSEEDRRELTKMFRNVICTEEDYEGTKELCPECDGPMVNKWSGVECSKCNYTFCY
jgi:hypothetical protein